VTASKYTMSIFQTSSAQLMMFFPLICHTAKISGQPVSQRKARFRQRNQRQSPTQTGIPASRIRRTANQLTADDVQALITARPGG
jgi:hypothetical protein